jgi:sugar lactone lactonase YvrE
VKVSGPGGFNQNVNTTQTLTGLAVGSYTVNALESEVDTPIVVTLYDPTVSAVSVMVTAGATATTSVSYAARPGTGALWVTNTTGPTAVAYSAVQLGASTGAAPATALGGALFGATFDAAGNLWVANPAMVNSTVVEFSASQLGASGSPTPAVTLSGAALNGPEGLAFDFGGNLWVVNAGSSTVIEFTPNQLGASGSPTPAVTLSATGGSLNNPVGLAFDPNGNLWVANYTSSTVVAFTPSQLVPSGSPMPVVTLSPAGGSLSGPEGLAFDGSGNLWVANNTSSTVVEFVMNQLGSPTPQVTLSATTGSLNRPVGLVFDLSGNLWVANGGGNTVVQFALGQLVGSGAPTPHVTLSGSSLVHPFGLAFDPSALPAQGPCC